MEKVAIYGAGALAKQIVAYNKRYNMFDIVAMIDDNVQSFDYAPEIPVLTFDKFKNMYPAKNQGDMTCMGGGKILSVNRLYSL